MAESETTQFLARNAAYHEAGHVTAAVLQDMHLRDRGIHVDSRGSGISYYCHRSPGDPANSAIDQLERERTIIALFAGIISQKKFLLEHPGKEAWASDRATICALLEELHPSDPAARSAAQNDLEERAERLVSQNWKVIEDLVSALLAKAYTPMPPIEIAEGWSRDKARIEKSMCGSEVVGFFKQFQIAALIRREEVEPLDEVR